MLEFIQKRIYVTIYVLYAESEIFEAQIIEVAIAKTPCNKLTVITLNGR